jgi:hypothetical protein
MHFIATLVVCSESVAALNGFAHPLRRLARFNHEVGDVGMASFGKLFASSTR